MASIIYDSALYASITGAVDFDSDSFKVMLVDGSYTPDKAAHSKRSDVSGEITGTGYSAGGSSVTVGVSLSGSDRIDTALGGALWSNATITAAAAVYYKSRGGLDSADELIAYIDFGGNVTATNGDFQLTASTLRLQN